MVLSSAMKTFPSWLHKISSTQHTLCFLHSFLTSLFLSTCNLFLMECRIHSSSSWIVTSRVHMYLLWQNYCDSLNMQQNDHSIGNGYIIFTSCLEKPWTTLFNCIGLWPVIYFLDYAGCLQTVKSKLSTTHHPQTAGQIECMN